MSFEVGLRHKSRAKSHAKTKRGTFVPHKYVAFESKKFKFLFGLL